MGRRISKEFLHPSILEGVNNKIGNLDSLETDAKGNMVQAINELADKIDTEIAEGKELIANAVGEPLTAEESFDEMSNDINGLLSTFKTNMMNNGITVESGDKFKSLIDKIATMVEEGEGKGVQLTQGTFDFTEDDDVEDKLVAYEALSSSSTIPLAEKIIDVGFNPTIFIAIQENDNMILKSMYIEGIVTSHLIQILSWKGILNAKNVEANNFKLKEYTLNDGVITIPLRTVYHGTYNWYAIGVGEKDTTLRDSLASILEEEGVSVTEEDDMASLISKVDEEFDNRPLPSLGDLSGVNHDFLFDISASGSTATVVSGYSIQLTGDYELIFDWSGPTINALRVGYVNIFKNNVSIKQYTLGGTQEGSCTFTFSAVKGDVLKITITGEGYSSSVSNLRLRGNLIF